MAQINSLFHYTSDQVWDPYTTLQLFNEDSRSSTCIGWAPSQRRRCRNPTNASCRYDAALLLEEISEIEPNFDLLKSKLRLLARYCMCKRWHTNTDQVEGVLSDWKYLIKAEQRRLYSKSISKIQPSSSRVRPSQSQNRKYNSKPSITTYHQTSASSASYRRRDSTISRLIKIEEALKLAKSSQRNSLDHIDDGSEEESEDSEDSDDDLVSVISAEHEAEHEAEQDNPLPTVTSSASNTEVLSVALATNLGPLLTNVPVLTNAPVIPCQGHHVARRQLSEECLICKESCNDTILSDLTWCKSRCGYSLHKTCYNQYLKILSSGSHSIKCPHW
jgi:hypothetical protein